MASLPNSPCYILNLSQSKRHGHLVIFKVPSSFKRMKWSLREVSWWQALTSWVKGQQVGEAKPWIPQVAHPSGCMKRLLVKGKKRVLPVSTEADGHMSAAQSCHTQGREGQLKFLLLWPRMTSSRLHCWPTCLRHSSTQGIQTFTLWMCDVSAACDQRMNKRK